jgi:crotonobetainyl-CoA:carnitine CoA-transferase CaiB-like acyl-CoA transferase
MPVSNAMGGGVNAGVLDGILVVDFTQAIAGPFATRILGEFGARVVKIESFRGDLVRAVQHRVDGAWGPMFGHGSGGKQSIAIDMSTSDGHQIVDRLLDLADVIVENFRPGTLERWDFDPVKLTERPRRPIVCSVSGFGRGTDYSGFSATDPLGQAISGMTYMIGEPGQTPYLAANGIADSSTAMSAATAILAALIGRQKDGKGRYIDLAMADVMLAMDCVNNPVAAAYEDVAFAPLGHHHPAVCPFGVFATSDGFVVIQAMGEGKGSTWASLCMAMGRSDLLTDPRTATAAARLENRKLVNSEVQRAVKELSRDDAVRRLQAAGAIAGPVLSPRDAVVHSLFVKRGGVHGVPTEDPTRSQKMVALPFGPAKLSGAPRRPPMLGEHTRPILQHLLNSSQAKLIASMRAAPCGRLHNGHDFRMRRSRGWCKR